MELFTFQSTHLSLSLYLPPETQKPEHFFKQWGTVRKVGETMGRVHHLSGTTKDTDSHLPLWESLCHQKLSTHGFERSAAPYKDFWTQEIQI